MAELLAYPLDDAKRYRLARAEAGRSAGTVIGYHRLLDRLLEDGEAARGAGMTGMDWLPWVEGCMRLMHEIALRPAGVRMDAGVLERLLKLKGLVTEAELHCLPAMDLARRENDALAERLIDKARDEAKRTPCAALTPGLVSDNLRFPGGNGQSGWPVFEHPTLSAAGPDGPRAGAAGPVPHSAGRCAVRLALAGLAAALFAGLVSSLRALLPDPLAGLFHDSRRSPHVRNSVKNPKNNNAGFTEGTIAPHRPRVMRKNRDEFHAGPLGSSFDDGSAA